MSRTGAPSFCAWRTREFINTVQREPRSTGESDSSAARANSSISILSDFAKLWRKEPQPEEQASLRNTPLITPSLMCRHFISCPPISITKSVPGRTKSAAFACATVSTSPTSTPKAAFISFSPYPVTPLPLIVMPSGISE